MNLKDVFLIADADGTLLTDDKKILDKDKEAIKELTDAGGMFTLATGRAVALARPVAEELNLEVPAVIFNGAAVYDFKKEKYLWQSVLPPEARQYIELIMDNFITLGVEILRGDDIYVVNSNPLEEEHLRYTGRTMNPIRCSLAEVPPDNWIKALFVGEPAMIDEVARFTDAMDTMDVTEIDGEPSPDFIERLMESCRLRANATAGLPVNFVRSSHIFYEMLPYGIDKGVGLAKLLKLAVPSGKFITAAGDFLNDIEMIQAADLGIAVKNAEEKVKRAADLIVCDNNGGAIREIVDYLKEKKV